MKAILQRGIGLLELMLSLAIIAVLLVMATRYYEVAHLDQQTNTALELVQALRAGATHYAPTGSYQGITMTELLKIGQLPNDIANNGGVPGAGADPWGGDVSILSVNSGANVRITMGAVPGDACENMKKKVASQAVDTTPTCAQPAGDFWVTF